MNIRPEKPTDYARIATINNTAFDNRASEPAIVALKRQYPRFDPDLSFVAEIDGVAVGNALFNPTVIRLMGEDVSAVNLAPIAVDPVYQGQGIGGALIEEGHRIAREKGCVVAFLLGHPTYYPRFGYQTHAYGASSVSVAKSGDATLPFRTPTPADLPALMTLWRHEENGVDFAIVPEDNLLWWLSPNSTIEARVYLRDDQIVGYSRHRRDVKQFLAIDGDTAQAMINTLAADNATIDLPLHPYSSTARALELSPDARTWEAGMAMELQPGPLPDYFEAVESGQRIGGRVIWDVAFEV
ncbi:MAG: N-acetyltransferase [Chloroflexi bacterium]|nr:N-acetyltransferase [Chloroflexota bacterium]